MFAVETDKLLKRREVAAILQVSVDTLARWATTGHGPKITRFSGTLVRYKQSDVEAWIESGAQVGG